MRLQDRSLVIREAAAEDAKLLWRWWNDGKVMEHAGFPRGLGISEEEVVELLTDGDPNQHRLILEVDSRPVGEMNYRDLGDGTAQIGIKICDFSSSRAKATAPGFCACSPAISLRRRATAGLFWTPILRTHGRSMSTRSWAFARFARGSMPGRTNWASLNPPLIMN